MARGLRLGAVEGYVRDCGDLGPKVFLLEEVPTAVGSWWLFRRQDSPELLLHQD